MTVFRVFAVIPVVSPSLELRPGVEVVLIVLVKVDLDPSLRVVVRISTLVETMRFTEVGAGLEPGLEPGPESELELVVGVH